MPFQIIDLPPRLLQAAATVLVAGFRELSPAAWPDIDSAQTEVQEMLQPGRICRCAIDETGTLLGWIGGLEHAGYDGHVWELHPLVVNPTAQGMGIGRALVEDLEQQVRQRGALTLCLGTDDETNRTSLSEVNLYENLWDKIQHIQNRNHHPFSFYQKLGYTIIGVMPDANGRGKPDIYMAKRL
jgi:aminoglycoside 6'-N-acetyltransferase I